MASRPRITAARVLAGIACAMLLPTASQASAPAHRAPHLSSHAAIHAVRHGSVAGEVIVRFVHTSAPTGGPASPTPPAFA